MIVLKDQEFEEFEDEAGFIADAFYKNDCLNIQKVMFHNGIFLTLDECYDLWSNYSTSLSASWLVLPDNNDILTIILGEINETTN